MIVLKGIAAILTVLKRAQFAATVLPLELAESALLPDRVRYLSPVDAVPLLLVKRRMKAFDLSSREKKIKLKFKVTNRLSLVLMRHPTRFFHSRSVSLRQLPASLSVGSDTAVSKGSPRQALFNLVDNGQGFYILRIY